MASDREDIDQKSKSRSRNKQKKDKDKKKKKKHEQRDKDRQRSKQKSKDKQKDRQKDRQKDKQKDKDKDRSRSRSQKKKKHSDKDYLKDLQQSGNRGKGRSPDRQKQRDRYRDKDKWERDRDRDYRDRDRDRQRDRQRDKDRDRDRERRDKQDRIRQKDRDRDRQRRDRDQKDNRTKQRERTNSRSKDRKDKNKQKVKQKHRQKERQKSKQKTIEKDKLLKQQNIIVYQNGSLETKNQKIQIIDEDQKQKQKSRQKSAKKKKKRSHSRSVEKKKKRQKQRSYSRQKKQKQRQRSRQKRKQKQYNKKRSGYDRYKSKKSSSSSGSDEQNMSDDPEQVQKLAQMKAAKQLVSSKADRKLYLGNLPPNITSQQLMDMLNGALKKMQINTQQEGDSIISAWISPDGVGHYAFVQFRSAQQATNGLTLNGASLFGYQLKLGRPKQYIQYNKTLLSQMGTDRNVQSILKKVSTLASNPLPLIQQRIVCPPSKIIVLKYIVSIQQLAIDEQFQQIYQDVRDMSKRFGQVIKLVIPRPHQIINLQQAPKRVKGLGLIFVQYKDLGQAKFARSQFVTKEFSGRPVACGFFDEAQFRNEDYDIQDKVIIAF